MRTAAGDYVPLADIVTVERRAGFSTVRRENGLRVVTVTGDISVIDEKAFCRMKDGAIVCNSGHFDVELDIPALTRLARKINRGVRHNVDEFVLAGGRRIYLLADGRLVNLACAEGHPASVMDMSFATQALAAEYACKMGKNLDHRVHDVPVEIEQWVARLKLRSMGVRIDKLTAEQVKYLSSSGEGT